MYSRNGPLSILFATFLVSLITIYDALNSPDLAQSCGISKEKDIANNCPLRNNMGQPKAEAEGYEIGGQYTLGPGVTVYGMAEFWNLDDSGTDGTKQGFEVGKALDF